MPNKNDVFFYSWQLRKRHHFLWTSQTNVGHSCFVRALEQSEIQENSGFVESELFVRAGEKNTNDDCLKKLHDKKNYR